MGTEFKRQVNVLLAGQVYVLIPLLSYDDWRYLSQIHKLLSKFNAYTLYLSQKRPHISCAIGIYYGFHNLLHGCVEKSGKYKDIDPDMANAMKEGLIKYKKYYDFIDLSDTCCTVVILDPRDKGTILHMGLKNILAAGDIVKTMCSSIERITPQSRRLGPKTRMRSKKKLGVLCICQSQGTTMMLSNT